MATIKTLQHHDPVLSNLGRTGSLAKTAATQGVMISESEVVPIIIKIPSLDRNSPSRPLAVKPRTSDAPFPSNIDKLREYARIGSSRARTLVREGAQPYKALSAQGKFAHIYIEPFHNWWRKTTTIHGKCLSNINVQDPNGGDGFDNVVNGVSQNYTGFYEMTAQSGELQREALNRLPIADAQSVPCLLRAANAAIAEFFGADFCAATSTGYGANYIALPALADKDTLVIMDSDSHNSLLTGAYLARPGAIRKFAHNDTRDLETILQETKGKFKNILVVVEGLYSMEADIPPLDDIWRLKEAHNFTLFCDEAHSFYSIGSTGRGCIQYWNEEYPEKLVPQDLIDIRTATLSKAIGGVGGCIFGKSKFEHAILERMAHLEKDGLQTLATSQMIQVLWVHGQPSRNLRYLHRLADISRFCRTELTRFGIHVYGESGIHILPIHAGRLSLSTRLSHRLRDKGLLGVPLSAPAVPFWQSRIRLNLSASHSDADINTILDAVIDGCKETGICKRPNTQRQNYRYVPDLHSSSQEELEASEAFKYISSLINRAAEELTQSGGVEWTASSQQIDKAIIQRGHDARVTHGLGSGGSRWFLTFPPHLAVESLIAKCTSMEACMTYPDAHIGLASTIAALSRPLLGYEKHYMLLPQDVSQAVKDGLVIAPKKGRPEVLRYQNTSDLYDLITDFSERKRTYLTVYIHVSDTTRSSELFSTLLNICKSRPTAAMTVLIDSPTSIPQTAQLKNFTKLLNIQVLVAGSFHEMLHLPGGFVSGSELLIKELRVTNRGYMFTTSVQPFIMEMVRASLENRYQTPAL